MPWDRGLEEVSIVVRVLFEPLWSSRPRAGVKKLDEHTGDRQGWMHGGGNGLELLQAGFPGAELVVPQVDDELVVTSAVVWLEQREEVEDGAPKGTKRGTSRA